MVITVDNPEELREEVIKLFYQELLGRAADEEGLRNHMSSGLVLEYIYILLKSSDEAVQLREEEARLRAERETSKKLPLSLTMIVKDNEDSVEMAINSVKEIVSEIVVLDTGSTDKTPEICKGLGARVYRCGFLDFGNIRTLCAHLARQPWVFMLDSDEMVLEEDLSLFKSLIEDGEIDAWVLPRKRWRDLEMTEQLELDVYPDWQVRLFRNKIEMKYTRRLHEKFIGAEVVEKCPNGPHIHHFQDVFKFGDRLKKRNELFRKLYDIDVAEGVDYGDCPAVAEIDNANN